MGEAIITRRGGGGGVKYAHGSMAGSGNGVLTITGIGFAPKAIYIAREYMSGYSYPLIDSIQYNTINEVFSYAYYNSEGYGVSGVGWALSERVNVTFSGDIGGQAVVTTGSSIQNPPFPSNCTYHWVAIG